MSEKTLFCTVPTESAAEWIIASLHDGGFDLKSVSFVLPSDVDGRTFASGPLVRVLRRARAEGSTGAISRGLVGVGVPSRIARRYEADVRAGSVLLSVITDAERSGAAASEIFFRHGALDVYAARALPEASLLS
jgi:hypothetical protein